MKKIQPLPSDIDPCVRPYCALLNAHGIQTFESCQGHPGKSHSSPNGLIFGVLRQLTDIKAITTLLTGTSCLCGTCKFFKIEVKLRADAAGIYTPETYWFIIEFRGAITDEFLQQQAERNPALVPYLKQDEKVYTPCPTV